jgi:hypothetical protein
VKFLCLAYGDEAGWNALTQAEREKALAADAVIRQRGNLMAAVRNEVHTVRNWDDQLAVAREPQAQGLPLAGFSVIEADSVEEVIRLVAPTPCARARGCIEIRPFWDMEAGPRQDA